LNLEFFSFHGFHDYDCSTITNSFKKLNEAEGQIAIVNAGTMLFFREAKIVKQIFLDLNSANGKELVET